MFQQYIKITLHRIRTYSVFQVSWIFTFQDFITFFCQVNFHSNTFCVENYISYSLHLLTTFCLLIHFHTHRISII